MEDCIFLENSEKSLEDCFFAEYTISTHCKIRPCPINFNCRNPAHLKISKIDVNKIEDYLLSCPTSCKIWLGIVNGNKPVYNSQDLRKLIYLKSGHIPKGYRVYLTCNNQKCLNFEHMCLVEKINTINITKLDYILATDIRKEWLLNKKSNQICEKYEITRQNLSLILNNKIWVDKSYLGKKEGFVC